MAVAQQKVYISGFVNDITTLQPLGFVNISSQGKVIAATDGHGFFSLSIIKGDTAVFTRLGYQPFVYVAKENNWDERIFMNEMSKVLDEVVIRDRYIIHGDDKIKQSLKDEAPSRFDNFTNDPRNQNQMIQTFGPAVNLAAPWEKWTSEAKEKKQLQGVLSEHQRTAVYQQFIQSMVVEQYMMETFNLDHETFIRHKEGFIVANPDARYLATRKDIIDLMVSYFAAKKGG